MTNPKSIIFFTALFPRMVLTFSSAAALATLASSTQAGTLVLDLQGVQAGQGTLVIALYNSDEDFMKKPLRKLTVGAA